MVDAPTVLLQPGYVSELHHWRQMEIVNFLSDVQNLLEIREYFQMSTNRLPWVIEPFLFTECFFLLISFSIDHVKL